MARRRFATDVDSAIAAASQRFGLPPSVMRAFAAVESGGNPQAQNGSYGGLFQLSPSEFRRGGGQGSLYDPYQNAQAAGRLLAGQRMELTRQLGREPNWHEVYLMHQQGPGGALQHLTNPTNLAWENMASTQEGRDKDARGPVYRLPNGERGLWSQAAVARNIPQASGLNWRTATSGDFVAAWQQRLERAGVPALVQPDMVAAISPTSDPGTHFTQQDQAQRYASMSPRELTQASGRSVTSPFEEFTGLTPNMDAIAASTTQPIVAGVEPTANPWTPGTPIFGGMGAFGKALSAAGRAIAGSGIHVPQFEDPAKQMAALDSGGQWPSIPARPQRRPPSVYR